MQSNDGRWKSAVGADRRYIDISGFFVIFVTFCLKFTSVENGNSLDRKSQARANGRPIG